MNPPLTPDEMYEVAKHRAITLSMMLSDMERDTRVSAAQRQKFADAVDLVDAALAILRAVPSVAAP